MKARNCKDSEGNYFRDGDLMFRVGLIWIYNSNILKVSSKKETVFDTVKFFNFFLLEYYCKMYRVFFNYYFFIYIAYIVKFFYER